MQTLAALPDARQTEFAAAETPVISIGGLSKVFQVGHASLTALDNLNFDVNPRELVVIVGPSGCGKSTLLKILTGLLQPTTGHLEIHGNPIKGPRRDVGAVFQAPLLFAWRTVLENVLLPADIQKLDRKRSIERAKELLELVGLADFANSYPNELSGGMQQRVAIARSLLHDPAILLMDEPFGALDAMTRERMNVELQRLWAESGKSILFITHSIPEAVFLADKVIVMTPRPGRIAEIIPVDLPRMRSLSIMNSPEFGVYVDRIRTHFGATGSLAS